MNNNEDVKQKILKLLEVNTCAEAIEKLKNNQNVEIWLTISKIVMKDQTYFERFNLLAAFGAVKILEGWKEILKSRDPVLGKIRATIEQIISCDLGRFHSFPMPLKIWIASCMLVRCVPTYSGRRAKIHNKLKGYMSFYSVTNLKQNFHFFAILNKIRHD